MVFPKFPSEVSATAFSIQPPAKLGSLQADLNKILGPLAIERPSTTIGHDHQTYLNAIEERYYGS